MRISDWSSDVCSSDLTPTISPRRGWSGAAAISRISRSGEFLIRKLPLASSTASPSTGVSKSRPRPVMIHGSPKPSGQSESIEVVRRTEPGRRSGAGPADWRAKGNCWGAFKMVILFGRHADGAAEPEILAVEICVAGQFEHQAAELLGLAQARTEERRVGKEGVREGKSRGW